MAKFSRNMTIPKEYLGAFKKGHRYSSRDMIDEEMSWMLLERIINSNGTDREAVEALTYLTKFNNEYHKNVIKKDDEDALHNTDELRRSCYARENAKNRDIMSVQNRNNPANETRNIDEVMHELDMEHAESIEDILIEAIDRDIEESLKY